MKSQIESENEEAVITFVSKLDWLRSLDQATLNFVVTT